MKQFIFTITDSYNNRLRSVAAFDEPQLAYLEYRKTVATHSQKLLAYLPETLPENVDELSLIILKISEVLAIDNIHVGYWSPVLNESAQV